MVEAIFLRSDFDSLNQKECGMKLDKVDREILHALHEGSVRTAEIADMGGTLPVIIGTRRGVLHTFRVTVL